MIFFGGSRGGGCGLFGCLPLLLITVVIAIIVLLLSGGNVFFFAV
jgi:hypothetical protein